MVVAGWWVTSSCVWVEAKIAERDWIVGSTLVTLIIASNFNRILMKSGSFSKLSISLPASLPRSDGSRLVYKPFKRVGMKLIEVRSMLQPSNPS